MRAPLYLIEGDFEYEATPAWAREHAIMQDPQPWHFLVSTTRKPSELGMTNRPSASSAPGLAAATQPVAAIDAMNRRRVSPLGPSVFVGTMLFLRPRHD